MIEGKKRTRIDQFEESLKLWGIGSQINMFAEEAGEALVAALHLRRNRALMPSLAEFAEELTDLEFMSEEMKYYLDKGMVRLTDKQVVKLAKVGVELTEADRELSFEDAMKLFREAKSKSLDQLLDRGV